MKIALLKDSDWSVTEGEVCRVIDFVPQGFVKDGNIKALDASTPYATVALECRKFPDRITGFITHKVDFIHLWNAFKGRGVKENEEVLISWYKKGLKTFAKVFAPFMPKLVIMICKKGSYELLNNPNFKPELRGEARYNAYKPIVEWKPKVME
ncbi:MAG: hypothetical protein L0Y80_06770 [Ignavibacteriae bacterium]|nr:hypothetical protein [Ignavibacteriota bacterium]